MSNNPRGKIKDLMGEVNFLALLTMADQMAESQWEEDFVQDQQDRYDQYRDKMYLSLKQYNVLKRMAEKDEQYEEIDINWEAGKPARSEQYDDGDCPF